ncbi:hypothetical protein GGR25_003649 [Kaistia hirudinis]|uniref:Uncharacterized protein n=1 Tax=Kaistia hirudinis TaxID=1293440 RepID=A0A840AUW7_9HYPH|nr:hypothetical protein [Kaistia hirudinis]
MVPPRRLVPQEQVQSVIAPEAAEFFPHARNQRRIIEVRRQVHAHVDEAAAIG